MFELKNVVNFRGVNCTFPLSVFLPNRTKTFTRKGKVESKFFSLQMKIEREKRKKENARDNSDLFIVAHIFSHGNALINRIHTSFGTMCFTFNS